MGTFYWSLRMLWLLWTCHPNQFNYHPCLNSNAEILKYNQIQSTNNQQFNSPILKIH